MNMKINTICFILLLFLLIGVANASNNNETVKITEINHDKIELTEIDNIKATVKDQLTSTSKAKVNLKANDVKMHYKDGSKFKITLKDNNKKVMKNTKIKIEINGESYTKQTDSKGTASINLNFKSGTYKVITSYAGSSKYEKTSIKNTVTIKSTIKTNDLTKYYKNSKTYSSTFYDKKGKLLKETSVKFKLNSKTYTVKTNKQRVARLNIDLKPGKYSVTSVNPKTSESISKTVTILNVVETHDLTMNAGDKSKFNVKILNTNGKVTPNKKVTLTVNGKTYTPKTNSAGIASLTLNLDEGTYTITTEYSGLKFTNKITVNKAIIKEEVKKTVFTHSILIPNYVNVTTDYVFHNSGYALKTGADGIIKMPKNDLFTIKIKDRQYLFSQSKISNLNTNIIGYQYHLIPFDGGDVKSDFKIENLKGDGIIISKNGDFTEINFKSSLNDNYEIFNVCLNQLGNITYRLDNNTYNINYLTYKFDESGLKYNIAKYYGENLNNFNDKSYKELIGNNNCTIKYTNSNESVIFNDSGKAIINTLSKEELTTKFLINNKEENSRRCFDVLESYAIIICGISNEIIGNVTSALKELSNITFPLNSTEITDYLKNNNITWIKDNPLTLFAADEELCFLNAEGVLKLKN